MSTSHMASWRALIIGMTCRSHASLACQYGYQKLGWMGKRNQKKILAKFYGWSRGRGLGSVTGLPRGDFRAIILMSRLVPALLLLGCGHKDLAEPLQSGEVFAWSGLQGRWVGPVVPSDPSCGRESQGLLSIGEGEFGFDPFQSTTVIEGKVADKGNLVGSLMRESPDHKPLSISFEAAATGSDTIKGELQSGRCHWAVTLHRG